MATYQTILYEKQRKGVLITLNRPQSLNAINHEMEVELHAALDEADEDPEVRAIVLTGAGRSFSTGYDLGGGGGQKHQWPAGLPEGQSAGEMMWQWLANNRRHHQQYLHLWELSKPVIAAVNGWALGGGSWYAIMSHIAIASENAVFAQPEVRSGGSSHFIWILAAGYKNAFRYSLTGDQVDAQEALRIGLVNKVVPPGELLEECFKVVERIALVDPNAVKANLFVGTMGLQTMGLHEALRVNELLQTLTAGTRLTGFNKKLYDAMEEGGLRRFLEARDGPFQPEPFGPRSRRR